RVVRRTSPMPRAGMLMRGSRETLLSTGLSLMNRSKSTRSSRSPTEFGLSTARVKSRSIVEADKGSASDTFGLMFRNEYRGFSILSAFATELHPESDRVRNERTRQSPARIDPRKRGRFMFRRLCKLNAQVLSPES